MKLRKNLLSKGTIKKVVKQDKITTMQKELDAVNGTRILIFEANTIEELFSIFALVLGVTGLIIFLGLLNGGSIKGIMLLLFGVVIVSYAQYRTPIDKYKESFMKDNELPTIIDTLIAGLDSGITLMNIFNYISKTQNSNSAKLIRECFAKVSSGENFNVALKEASEKSFNHYFIRMAQIIKKADTSTLGLSDQLRELQIDIEEERLNMKMERVNKLDNALFFPILLGYFIPLVLMIVLPFLTQFQKLQM